jgi:DNA repair protein RecN (Recombination protein N)
MLAELAIRNFAIIDELHLQFDDGMNALTGETGAGKSIIIDALGAVLGERVGSEVVRTGASVATTEAVFDLGDRDASEITAMLDELGIDDEDGTLILSRQIAAGGRSSARINGRPVTVGALNQLGALLIDIHGQSDHLKLLQASAQLDALDHYAGTLSDRDRVRELVRELHAIRTARNRLRSGEREREQRIDLLMYQIDEITSAALEEGEDERIANERAVLANAERLLGDAAAALQALEPDDDAEGAASLLRSTLHHVQRIAEVDASTAELVERVNEVVVLADDVASDLRRYVESVDADPARLVSVDERFDLIVKLKRKYGATIPEIQEHLEAAQAELETVTGAGFDEAALAEQEAEIRSTLAPVLDALSAARRKGADRLEAAIDAAIAELGLGSAHVGIAITRLPDPTETGADAVEFLFAPNKGEALKPLAKIASGGETARLMLALKSVLAEGDRTPTLVFDEVDVGVGARSGQSVGEKLWSLANRHQVIVISHLAQIAAFAGAHFMIEKDVIGERTVSTVRRLEAGTRLDELAEMIDGKPVSPESRAAAEQLMDRISSIKRTGG